MDRETDIWSKSMV